MKLMRATSAALVALLCIASFDAGAQLLSPAGVGLVASHAAYATTARDYSSVKVSKQLGLSDGKQVFFSLWFRVDAGDGTSRQIINSASSHVAVRLTASNKVEINLVNASGFVSVWFVVGGTSVLAGSGWHHLAFSIDAALAGTRSFYLDGSADGSAAVTNSTFALSEKQNFASMAGGTSDWDGCMSEYIFDDSYLDLSSSSNRLLIRTSGGKPANVGADASTALGHAARVYSGNGNPSTNAGTAGNYVVDSGTITACSTSPSD